MSEQKKLADNILEPRGNLCSPDALELGQNWMRKQKIQKERERDGMK